MTNNNSTVGYQFTPMPKQLTHLLDVNLRSMLFALIDASNYFADEDGWFYRTNDQLHLDSDLSKNLVIATIDTLFQHSLVEVSCSGTGKGRKPNNYKVNLDSFKFFEQLDINIDLHRPGNQIETVKYNGSGYHATYLDDKPVRYLPELVKGRILWNPVNPTGTSTPDDTTVPTTDTTKELTMNVTKNEHNTDNINNIYNKEYIDNIDNLYNIDNVKNKDNTESNNNKISINNNILYENTERENKELLEREFEKGLTEPNSKDENEGKEYPSEYQVNIIPTGENQDLIPSGVQAAGSSPLQPNDDDTRQQEGDASSTNQSPLEEAVTGIKMVGLFDSEPSNQRKPMLSVRAATRLWAEELETKYQTRERTLQNLAMEHSLDFEKYVNYLRTQRRPAFQKHIELIHDLAVAWEIDVDLDQD